MLDKTYPTMTKLKKGHEQSKGKVWLSNYRHSGETNTQTKQQKREVTTY